MSEEAERTTTRLLANLDDVRRARLTDAYKGEPPDRLCARCSLPTFAMLNGVSG